MAARTLYLHQDGAGLPANNAFAKEAFPDAAEDTTSGHGSTATANNSILVKPGLKEVVEVGGLPPTAAPPAVAHRFGWFTELKYHGTLPVVQWTFQKRRDDNRAGITGTPIVNVYKSTTQDFAGTMTFLFQSVPGPDWWLGAVSTISWTTAPDNVKTLINEFLWFQVWCQETAGISDGRIHTLHTEGSALAEATVSKVVIDFVATPHLPSRWRRAQPVVDFEEPLETFEQHPPVLTRGLWVPSPGLWVPRSGAARTRRREARAA